MFRLDQKKKKNYFIHIQTKLKLKKKKRTWKIDQIDWSEIRPRLEMAYIDILWTFQVSAIISHWITPNLLKIENKNNLLPND